MNKLKIAVIGTGLVGSFHAETFFRNPNSELIAVCDIDKEKVNKIANRFKCKAYNEFEENGQMKDSAYRDRIVDVMEELMRFTYLTRDDKSFLGDRYSERKNS